MPTTDTLTPPSSPMLGQEPPEPETPLTLEPEPVPPDVDEPTLPPAVVAAVTPSPAWLDHEALLQGFMQHFQAKVTDWLHATGKEAMSAVEDMHSYLKRQLEVDRDNVRHAETALDQLVRKTVTEGMRLRMAPYQMHVEAASPEGYPVSLTIWKDSAEDLLAELPDVLGWLADNHYGAVTERVAR